MLRFLHSRLLRCIVCFCLIFALVVNISPIKAKAVDPVTLTGAAMLGLACLVAAGVVVVPASIEMANKLGDSIDQKIKDVTILYPDYSGIYDYYIRMCNKLDNRFSPDWDPNEFHDDLEHALANGLLAVIVSMLALTFFGDGMHIDGETAPNGYTFYGEHCLVTAPVPTDALPYVCIRYYPSNQYNKFQVMAGPNPFYVRLYEGNPLYLYPGGSTFTNYVLTDASDTSWSSYSPDSSYVSLSSNMYIVWSNHDIVEEGNSNNVVFEGSDATNVQKETVVPEIYVGDIPQKIEDGERDPEKLGLPFIDPLKIFTNGDTALEDYTNIADKLKSGQLTYEDFVEQYRHEQESGGDSGGSTEPPVEDPTNPSEPGDNIDDILPYALDLTDFFPFCIPFDLYDLYSSLAAAPETPVFDLNIAGYTVTVDLSPWDDFAAYFRKFQLLLFVIGLAASSRKFIKW